MRIADGVAETLEELSPFDSWRLTEEARAIGSRFYFTLRSTPEIETLWSSSGRAAETVALWSSAANERVLDLYELAGELFFVVAGERAALWRSDGTVTGTRLVADLGRLRANADDTRAHSGLELEGRLYFVGENAVAGAELWSSNGTQVGTRLHDLVPGIVGSEPRSSPRSPASSTSRRPVQASGARSGCSILRLDARPASATSPTEGSPRFRRS